MTQKYREVIARDRINAIFTGLSRKSTVFVSAPGGYGKTLAVRQWLNNDPRTDAVVSLDEYDNDPMHFCERFCTVLRVCQPQNTALEEIVVHPAFSSAPIEFSLRAIDMLTRRKHCILVIDDLHIIHDKRTIGLILLFLENLPENIQIVLISRTDLPEEFSILQQNGDFEYITANDLLFNNEEIINIYKSRDLSLSPRQADEIFRYTGGWAIGINAMLLSGNEPSEGNLEYLEDFILSSIWEKWSNETREFMINTAAANEMHPALCSELTGIHDCENILIELMQKGAFIYMTEDGIYHYHHLFRDFLRNRLAEKGDVYLFSLLNKEGYWYLSKYDFYAAADCFIRSKNHEGIAKCFDLLEIVDRDNFVISRMIPIVKNPEIYMAAKGKYPFLYYMMSWVALAEGRTGDMEKYMDQYYTRYPEILVRDPALYYNIFFMYLFDIRMKFVDILEKISILPYEPETNNKGIRGSIAINIPTFHRSTLDFSELATNNTEESVMYTAKENLGWLFGAEADLICSCITAWLLYEQGHLEKAHVFALTANTKVTNQNSQELKFCILSALYHILDAMNLKKEAEHLLDRINENIEQHKAYYLIPNFEAMKIRKELAGGNINAARYWLTVNNPSPFDHVSLYGIYQTFTTCRAYLTCGEYDSAIIFLTGVLGLAKEQNRVLDIIEANILLAVAYKNKNRNFIINALHYLENAVSLAYPFEYTQIFVNEGADLNVMLEQLVKNNEQKRNNTENLYTEFIKTLFAKTSEHHNNSPIRGKAGSAVVFTDKQKAIISQLNEGKNYNEIMEVIGIKRTTLRSHLSLIYKKLGVSNGVDAVNKIKQMELI